MVKHGIRIYARVRPTKKNTGAWEVGELEDGSSSISFSVPKSKASGLVNNKKELYSFKFDRVFDDKARQEDVFQGVASSVVDNCLEGYNGTIFAYGQTGSGKTFTITGGAERYSDRGIIPRTLSHIFKHFQENPEKIFTLHVSYLEIYNECGYDLLDSRHEASKLEDLPRVTLMERAEGAVHLKNLSLQPAGNEEEALNWLFLGDTNRMIAETPMNMASTRSHCIFTVYTTVRDPGSNVIRKSKLHLVDLAGSERIGKTGVGGTLLTEAKYINLSLHFLEQVIVALSEKSRTHIPYRNSMMTSVLRDSLGGNCMTTMIATCSVERGNIDESISTCRFAQRVALIKNDALLNEEIDPKMMVARLKQQVLDLKEELALATGKERTDALSQEASEWCKDQVEQFVRSRERDAKLSVGADMRMINLCFKLLKAKIVDLLKSPSLGLTQQQTEPSVLGAMQPEQAPLENRGHSDAEWQKLKGLLKQRDDEINILVKMLKQEKRRAAEAEGSLAAYKEGVRGDGEPMSVHHGRKERDSGILSDVSSLREDSSRGKSEDSLRVSSADMMTTSVTSQKRAALKAELSKARQEAFEIFRRDYALSDNIEQQKRSLKAKYAEAKALGERVNTSRLTINEIKSQIERIRVSRVVMGDSSEEADEREEELRCKMEKEKGVFKEAYHKLKEMKSEVEHMQHLLERAKVQLQKDFEVWWEDEAKKMRQSSSRPSSSRKSSSSSKSKHHSSVPTAVRTLQSAHYSDSPVWKSHSERIVPLSHGPPPVAVTSVVPLSHGPPPVAVTSVVPLSHGPPPVAVTSVVPLSHGPPPGAVTSGSILQSSWTMEGGKSNSQPNLDNRPKGNSVPHTSHSHGSIPLTGDRKADADIIAFYKARQKLIERGLKRTS